MDSREIIILISMIAYMAIVIIVGLIYGKKNRNAEEYYLGGRGLGPWVAAMSAEASDMSSWLLMGLPGLAYLTGFADAAWTAIGLALGTYLNWRITSVRLRKYTQVCNNSITLPDFFSNRFRDEKKILMTIAAILILFFFTIYTSSGFAACGKLFNSIFGLDYRSMMLVSALVIVIYTIVGGFLAESTVDFIQGGVMSVALILVLIAGVSAAGGFSNAIETFQSRPGFLSLFDSFDPTTGASTGYAGVSIASGLAWGLGYFGMPHVLLRFMAIRNSSELKKSRIIGTTWCVVSLCVAVLAGAVGSAIPAMQGLAGADSERIFVIMAEGLLPAVLAGVVLAGILAAQMSTSDSQLLVTSSAISTNIYKGILKKDATDKQVMWVSRITVVVVAILAAILALDPNSSIFNIVSYAWAGFGATFGPLVLFSIFWKRTTFKGALAGMLSGAAVVVLWKSFVKPLGGWFGIYELLPAFVVSCLCIYIFSKLDREPSKEIQDEFDSVATCGF